jgi:hypothetical protein
MIRLCFTNLHTNKTLIIYSCAGGTKRANSQKLKEPKQENTMTLPRMVVVGALLVAHSVRALAQAPTGSILHMEIENSTLYIADCPNSQLATSPNKLTRPAGGAFESAFGIGDIVSVNGMRVKGASYQTVFRFKRFSQSRAPGRPCGLSTTSSHAMGPRFAKS